MPDDIPPSPHATVLVEYNHERQMWQAVYKDPDGNQVGDTVYANDDRQAAALVQEQARNLLDPSS
tara:strand:- start:2193 stop:2387 length:195 start_codon:yes stop_codon:yes gene_type:complete